MNRKQLITKIKNVRREYIRARDSKGEYTPCISCDTACETKNMQVGHYYHGDFHTELTEDERNVNLQCVKCNYHKSGEARGYAIGLINKYGEGVLQELSAKKKAKYYKMKDLEKLLEYYQSKL